MVILKLLGSKMEYNKKEQLLDKINGLRLTSTNASDTLYNRGVVDAFRRTNEFFDEELIPEVPAYVAEWYEDNKGNLDYNLWNYIMDWDEQEPDKFLSWFNSSSKAFKTIVNMHQFSYKIKKEKKYKVKFKNVQKGSESFKFDTISGKWYFGFNKESSTTRLYHTKEELEANGFGGVFGNPMFEVEEVKSE